MRLFGIVVSVSLITLALSACTTSEALTPRADIGQPGHSSTPVTEVDTQEMAGNAIAPARRQPAPAQYPASPPPTGQGSSLDAQAQALASGHGSSPASSGPPPQWQGQGQDQGQDTATSTQNATPPAGDSRSASLPANSAAAQNGGTTIRFLPIIGAPVQAVTPLSRKLAAEARAAGLVIRPSTDNATQNILKGYFSAFVAEGKVTVVYVWDILDPAGARLHRMQGQETVPAAGQDPWAAVPASLMEAIATRSMQDYMAWLRTRTG